MALYQITLETTAAALKDSRKVIVHASDKKGGYVTARAKAEWRLNRIINRGWRAVRTKRVG